MTGSVANKAFLLLKDGRVDVEDPTFNKMRATVITNDEKGNVKDHDVMVWRDGHWSCTCDNFSYSKSEVVNYWGDETRAKPECKHSLAVKMSPEYKHWIRMIVVPTNDGFALRTVEMAEEIRVKSLEDKINVKELLPKVKTILPVRGKTRISFNDIFGD